MKEDMHVRFVPEQYKRYLFHKLQSLRQGTKSVDEYYKEMETAMMRANVKESSEQTMARFLNGLNYPIKRVMDFNHTRQLLSWHIKLAKAREESKKTFITSRASKIMPLDLLLHHHQWITLLIQGLQLP
jgi:hypothetical protein